MLQLHANRIEPSFRREESIFLLVTPDDFLGQHFAIFEVVLSGQLFQLYLDFILSAFDPTNLTVHLSFFRPDFRLPFAHPFFGAGSIEKPIDGLLLVFIFYWVLHIFRIV